MTHPWPAFIPKDIKFESFTYPFFDFGYDADPRSIHSAFMGQPDRQPQKGMRGLYVHIPFCDTICEFCPFLKSVPTNERIAAYLTALSHEIDLVARTPLAQSWNFDAIYIGGGTPSVLSPQQASDLLNKLKRSFRVNVNAEVTFEVEPKSVSVELYDAIAAAGANRVSFGVQTLDPQMRKDVNLTATENDIHRTVELSLKYFNNTNLDMIVGFPGQTIDEAVQDMHRAVDLGIGSVSMYPMDYITANPRLLDRIRHGTVRQPLTGEARWEMFHEARAALASRLEIQNMYCFGRPGSPKCKYMFETLYGGYHDQCLGLGLGSYTVVRGLISANVQSEKEYVESANKGELPIYRSSPGHAYEKSLVYFPKRLTVDLSEAIELGIGDQIMPKFEALAAAGLLNLAGIKATLTEQGERAYAQIMVGMLSDHQRRLYERACARMTRNLNWDIAGAIDGQAAKIRGMAVKNALADRDGKLRPAAEMTRAD